MFKANVGSSVAADARTAGREAAAAAQNGLDHVKFAFVYGSCAYGADEMTGGVKDALPGVPLLGNTSFTGIITPDGFVSSDKGFVGVMAFSDEDLTVGTAAYPRGADPFETGRAVALAAMMPAGKDRVPDYFYMGASAAEEEC